MGVDEAFAKLARSKFRSRFRLSAADRKYITDKGMATIRSHAADFVRTRLAPANPPNDGRQTPMRGHPVFKAQHATATCCRSCLEKWWKIPKGTEIPPERQSRIVDFLMAWIEKEYERGQGSGVSKGVKRNASLTPNPYPLTPIPSSRTPNSFLTISGCSEQNLKNVTAHFPIGAFTVVSGVSGSGKSTLVEETLKRSLMKKFYKSKARPGKYKKLTGDENFDKVIEIDQSPIGRTPRSNPATYVGFFSEIRELFAKTEAARARGYTAGRFSFNVKGGRCEVCGGDGLRKLEMSFLPDVYVTCEQCGGKRFNAETLEVTYGGKSIAEVLEMTVAEAYEFFAKVPSLARKLKTLVDVGLGYIALGQSATTLSGGEAQRIKLATELSKRSTGRTLYLLDEPTTGLHFDDVAKLMNLLLKLRDQGNTIIVIEHNIDVIRSADWIVDMGPGGGSGGGEVVVEGPLEKVKSSPRSFTAKFL